MPTNKPRVFAYLPTKKHQAFRIACAVLGYTTQEIIETAVDDAIRRVSAMDLSELLAEGLTDRDIDFDALAAMLAEAQ